MKLMIHLLLLPLLGGALILAGFLWCGDELAAAWNDEKHEGTIAAMIKSGPGGVDLITGLNHHLKITRADGSVLEVDLTNHRTTAVLDAATADAALASWVNQAVMSDAEALKRSLLRENAGNDSKRVVRIEKTEYARGYFGMKEMPTSFEVLAGEVIPVSPKMEQQVMTTSAVISGNGAEGRADTLQNYSRTHPDNTLKPARKDFAMYDSDFDTLFIPVFTYRESGTTKVGLSDIGKKGGVPIAYRLFSSCKVASITSDPAVAMLLPNFSSLGSSASPLLWFSAACEGFFSRWVYGFVLIGTGLAVSLMGAIVVSLRISSSRSLHNVLPLRSAE